MGNGRGILYQYYRDSIDDKTKIIEELESTLNNNKSEETKLWFDHFKQFFYRTKDKAKDEIKQQIKLLRKSIKKDELEMYD